MEKEELLQDKLALKKRKNTIILFHPKLRPEIESSSEVRFAPLGLLAIAAPVLEYKYNVIIIDSNKGETWNDKDVEVSDIVCVGISAMTGYQIRDGLDFSTFIRQIDPTIPIVWGGIHVSLLPEQAIENTYVDIIVTGQGEETFLELVKCLSNKMPLNGIRGIYYKEHGEVIKNSPRPFVDPNKFPPAPYHLLNMDSYLNEAKMKVLRSSDAFLGSDHRFLYYCSSIGCPYRCRFCASTTQTGGRWVGFGAERVLDDIERLVKEYRIDSLQFCDAEFFIDRKRAKEIAQGLIDRKLGIRWKAQVRADTFDRCDEDMLDTLKKSGYIHVEIGVEFGSQRMLDFINKKITPEMVIRCAEKIKKYDMFSSFCFVFGFPTETKEDIVASFRLASKLKEILPRTLLPIYFFDPYPGVPLYYDSIERGMKPPKSLEEWANIRPDMRLPSPLIPWVDKNYMDYVHKVFIFYLPLAFPADIGLGTLTYIKSKLKTSKVRWLIWVGHKIARWRVKHQFFTIPLEWKLFKLYRWYISKRN